jgi:hypothetical protein
MRRDTALLDTPTVPATAGSTDSYLRVDTPLTRMSRTRAAMCASPVRRSYAGTATSFDVASLRSRGCLTCSLRSASVTWPRCVPCHSTSPSARPRSLAPASSCADSISSCSMSPRAASFISSSMLAWAFSSSSSIGSSA